MKTHTHMYTHMCTCLCTCVLRDPDWHSGRNMVLCHQTDLDHPYQYSTYDRATWGKFLVLPQPHSPLWLNAGVYFIASRTTSEIRSCKNTNAFSSLLYNDAWFSLFTLFLD